MPIIITWYDETERVIVQTFKGAWTLEEYYRSLAEMNAMYAHRPYIVHVIGDFTEAQMAPTNLLSVRGAVEAQTPDNRGLGILVQPGRFIEILLTMVSSLAPRFSKDLHVVATMDEALALIARYVEP